MVSAWAARICRCPDVEGALALAQAFSHRILRPLKLLSWGDGAMMRSWSFSSMLAKLGFIMIIHGIQWDIPNQQSEIRVSLKMGYTPQF